MVLLAGLCFLYTSGVYWPDLKSHFLQLKDTFKFISNKVLNLESIVRTLEGGNSLAALHMLNIFN